MKDCRFITMPLSSKHNLHQSNGTSVVSHDDSYWSIVRALQYFPMIRPDWAYSINLICQFMHAPSVIYHQAVRRVLYYVKETTHYGLHILTQSIFHLYGLLMLIWQVIWIRKDPSQVNIRFLDLIVSLGVLRSNLQCLVLVLKTSIVPWQSQLLKSHGLLIFFKTLRFLSLLLQPCSTTT